MCMASSDSQETDSDSNSLPKPLESRPDTSSEALGGISCPTCGKKVRWKENHGSIDCEVFKRRLK